MCGGAAAGLRGAARRAVRPARARTVALSGLDGAGKSLQAAALRDTLARLGHDAIVVRTRISWEEWLWNMVPPLKRALTALLRPFRAREPARGGEPDRVKAIRERSRLLTDVWLLVITLANAWSQWRLMHKQLLRGGLVICDRYTLDSIVELRYSYGEERPMRLQRAALRWLYPKPVRAYFLDVSPTTALRRKGEWGEEWLRKHRELYLRESPRLDVTVLDGEQASETICAQIAREVWLSGI